MTKTCIDCGREFTAVKLYYTVCFDCHIEQIKQARADLAALCLPRPRSNKQGVNKLSISGGATDAMQSHD